MTTETVTTELFNAQVDLRITQNKLNRLLKELRDLEDTLNDFSARKAVEAAESESSWANGLYRGYHSGYQLAAHWLSETIDRADVTR